MRKTRVIGLVVASLVSAASLVQAQSATPNARQERHAAGRGMEGRQGRGGLFRGITLSDAEKARMKQVHEKYATEAKSLRESLRPAMQEARTARQKGDTAGVKAAWGRTSGQRDKLRALMDRERSEMRTALSTENQKQFDANVKQLQERRAGMKQKRRPGRNG